VNSIAAMSDVDQRRRYVDAGEDGTGAHPQGILATGALAGVGERVRMWRGRRLGPAAWGPISREDRQLLLVGLESAR